MHPIDEYSKGPFSVIREQLRDLKNNKADKAVIKSEFKGVRNQIGNAENDIDEIKAQLLVKPSHSCVHEGDIGEMKRAIEANERLSEEASRTASLASDRGFKILLGAVAGLVSFGVAFCVWAVSVSYTAQEALEKADAMKIQLAEEIQPDYVPPQIIIASPEYLTGCPEMRASAVTESGEVADFESLLEQALIKALDARDGAL